MLEKGFNFLLSTISDKVESSYFKVIRNYCLSTLLSVLLAAGEVEQQHLPGGRVRALHPASLPEGEVPVSELLPGPLQPGQQLDSPHHLPSRGQPHPLPERITQEPLSPGQQTVLLPSKLPGREPHSGLS